VHSNLVGFANVLELARSSSVRHLVYASSSSVYGANRSRPYAVSDEVNQPISFYAATKRANEVMAESYSHLYGIPSTGLRFFTVYGPWGRPDMAIFSFTQKMLAGEPIELYGDGLLSRDFTFIDDIVDGVIRCLDHPPAGQPQSGSGINQTASPHRIFNLGNGEPVSVVDMVSELERALGIAAVRVPLGRPNGDVEHTLADISATTKWCGYRPRTSLAQGIPRFVDWYRNYYPQGFS
jgi:UDP-glucuronate 4-epimerase